MLHRLAQPRVLILLAANLVPLVGVIAWDWDAFVLLILYWLETSIIAFWTVLRIATLPPNALAEIQIGTEKTAPSSLGLALFFTLHSAIFMGVHFLFLWALFAGEWAQRIHGVNDFLSQMVVDTGLWLPLLVLFVARGGLMLFDVAEPYSRRKLGLPPARRAPSEAGPGETLLFGLYIRIAVMQVTIIIGAWFAMFAGNAGALVFLIALKTAIDLSFQFIAGSFHTAWTKAKAEQAAKPQG